MRGGIGYDRDKIREAATLIVAASNSLHPERADYHCDGTADNVEIQAAIDALPTTGGGLLFLDGIFTLNTQISRAIDNVNIYGMGTSTKLELDGYTPIISAGSQSGWVFKDLNVDYGGLDVGSKQNKIINCFKEGALIEEFLFSAPYISHVTTVADVGHTGSHDVAVKDGIAYVCNYADDYFISIDIKDPENPIILDRLTDVALNGIHDIVIDGNYAYVTNIIRHSIVSIDISDPSTLSIADELQDDAQIGACHALCKRGDYIYIANYTTAPDWFNVIDASDPTNLNFAGGISDILLDDGRSICVKGDYAFLVSRIGRLLSIDISDPANPSIEDNIDMLVPAGEPGFISIKCKDDYAYVTDLYSNALQVFNISDPAALSYVTTLSLMGYTNYIQLHGDYAFIGIIGQPGNIDAVQIVDISDPTSPSIIAMFSHIDLMYASGLAIWGKYILVSPRDRIDTVLTILQISGSSERHSDLFMDVLAVSATHVRSNEDLSEAIPNTFTIDAQPDVPRTLSGHFDAHAQITAYTIVFSGVDAKGNTITETKSEADGWDWETSNAFATITSIIMIARTGTGAGDTMDIGITDVLGLSNIIYATGDVFKIKKNNGNAVVAAAQVDVDYDTYDFSVIGLAGGDDFTCWFRSNLNIIS